MTTLTGKVCQCTVCGKVFTTANGFDRHRVGRYDLQAPGYGRRCLNDAELTAINYGLNARGRWCEQTKPLRLYLPALEAAQIENRYEGSGSDEVVPQNRIGRPDGDIP